MKENLIIFFKGFIIGIGKIIPGISGAFLAMLFGVYDRIMNSLDHIFNYKNYKFMFYFGLGFIMAIILTSKLIFFLLKKYYLSTMLLFMGIIISSFYNEIKKRRIEFTIKTCVFIFTPLLIIIPLYMFYNINFSFSKNILYYFILGIIESISMLIPGVSGSALLMMTSDYEIIIMQLSTFSKIYIILPFLIGILIGFLIFSKLINKFINKYLNQSQYIVIGFFILSVIILLKTIFNLNCYISEYIISSLMLFIGLYIGYKI